MRDDELIRDLTNDLKPGLGLRGSEWDLLLWMVASFALLLPIVIGLGIRRDVMRMLETSSYPFQLFTALALAIVTAGTALHLRIPGARAAKKVISAFFLIWILAVVSHGSQWGGQHTLTASEAFRCVGLALGFALLPGLVLLALVKRGRSTEPQLLSLVLAVSMLATASAFLPLVCRNDSLLHLLLTHVLPVFPLSLIFWRFGPRLLRW